MRRVIKLLCSLGSAILAMACASAGDPPSVHGGQTGAETGLGERCQSGPVSEFSLDAATPTGFSAEELSMAVTGPFAQEWRWATGESALARLTVEAAMGPAHFVAGGDAKCPAELSVSARLRLSTDDQRLNEDWLVLLRATDLEQIEVASMQPIVEFAGSLRPTVPDLQEGELVDSYALALRVTGQPSSAERVVSGELIATVQLPPGSSAEGGLAAVRQVLLGDFAGSD